MESISKLIRTNSDPTRPLASCLLISIRRSVLSEYIRNRDGPQFGCGCEFTHLDRVLVGQEVDDFECVGNDADGEEFLAIVAAFHHHSERG
jgi:hypothetical protein